MQASEALVAGAHSRLRRLDLRVAVGVLLMLVAVLGGASLIRSAQDRTPVLVAAGSVQPGEVIGPSDLRVVEMSVPAGVAYLSASAEGQIEGRVAAEPLWDGKVLGPGSVAEAPPVAAGMVAITLLLPPESAVGGNIRSGDRVAVLSSPGVDASGGNQQKAATTILLPVVPVLSVRDASTSEGEGVFVTLTLRLDEARAVAEARASGRVDLALLPGGTS
ncbi:MAG: Flp pilus assembly protein CpaB [Actinomycetota bacterium]